MTQLLIGASLPVVAGLLFVVYVVLTEKDEEVCECVKL